MDNAHLRLLLAFALNEDSNCVDIGACYGGVLDEILRVAPRGLHHAFEPIPVLGRELARRAPPGVEVHQVALSDTEGEAPFVLVPESPGFSGLREQDYPRPYATRAVTVRTRRLDDCLPAGYVPRLIKIDVEGAEMQVLRGAVETITRSRPLVVFEHGRAAARYGTEPADVYGFFVREAGMRIFDLDGAGPYSESAFEEMVRSDVRWNYVAHA